jgi:hypothetical protein
MDYTYGYLLAFCFITELCLAQRFREFSDYYEYRPYPPPPIRYPFTIQYDKCE